LPNETPEFLCYEASANSVVCQWLYSTTQIHFRDHFGQQVFTLNKELLGRQAKGMYHSHLSPAFLSPQWSTYIAVSKYPISPLLAALKTRL